MKPLPHAYSPSLEELQRYVAEMEQERGFTHSSTVDQCLKLAEETGEVCKAVRKQAAMSSTRRAKLDRLVTSWPTS